MLMNIDAFVVGLFELLENALRAIQLSSFAFEFNPTITGCDFHSQRIFKAFQEFEIVCVKGLDHSCAFKLQGARFSHCERDSRMGYDRGEPTSISSIIL